MLVLSGLDNLLSDNKLQSKIIGNLYYDSGVTIHGKNGNWYYIHYNDESQNILGWVHKSLISLTEECT